MDLQGHLLEKSPPGAGFFVGSLVLERIVRTEYGGIAKEADAKYIHVRLEGGGPCEWW